MPWPPQVVVSSFEPSDKIRGLMPIWRESAKALRSLRQDELGPREQLLILADLTAVAAHQRRLFRRYLMRRFAFDPLRGDLATRAQAIADAIYEGGPRHFVYFMDAMNTFIAFQRLFELPNRVGEQSQAAGASFDAAIDAAWAELLAELDRAALAPARATEVRVGDYVLSARLYQVSAWAATNLSLDRNARLRAALSGSTSSPFERLLLELPAAALLAWSEIAPGAASGEFLNRIAHLIEQEGASSDAGIDRELPVAPDVEVELFTRAEEASHELAMLREQAQLSPREAEVLDLGRAGYKGAEIAEQLGIKPGTVKATASHAREKLRRAAD